MGVGSIWGYRCATGAYWGGPWETLGVTGKHWDTVVGYWEVLEKR